jgi:hypothetical protein
MKLRRIALLITLSLFIFPQIKAQDIFAGFISARQIEGFEYEFTLTTWTNDWHNPNFKRCAVDFVVFFNGAATNMLNVPRVNGGPQQPNPYCPIVSTANAGEKIKDKVRKNIYKGRYNFTGAGTAKVVWQSKGREINISNIAFPFATNFSVETEFEIFAGGTQNSTPELNADLLVPATSGTNFSFTNYVTEPDNGDGMNFSERVPSSVNPSNHTAISNFGGAYTVNNSTGAVTWASPSSPGFLLGSIKIDHSRGGTAIGYSYLDYIIEMDRSASLPEVLASDVKIGPQPAVDFLALTLSLTQSELLGTRLLDMTGRTVQQFTPQQLVPGRQEIQLELDSRLSDGLYVLEMQFGGEKLSRKVMIRR